MAEDSQYFKIIMAAEYLRRPTYDIKHPRGIHPLLLSKCHETHVKEKKRIINIKRERLRDFITKEHVEENTQLRTIGMALTQIQP